MNAAEKDDLISALSAAVGIDRAEKFSDEFLKQLVDQVPAITRALAAEYGWNETEVRDTVCAVAQNLLAAE